MGSNANPAGPIIDCSTIGKNLEDFAQKLGNGIEHTGFVYLINHGYDQHTIDNLNEKLKEFFNLPVEFKRKYTMVDPFKSYCGYTPANIERQGDFGTIKDSKECFDFSGPEGKDEDSPKFPFEISGFKKAVDEFRKPFTELTQNLLRAFAVYLNLDDSETFVRMHTAGYDFNPDGLCLLRTLYYPAVTLRDGEETNRLGEHCDIGTFTYVFQDNSGGLEARTKNGDWIPILPIPGSIAVMTGVALETLSGGKLMPVTHRVRAVSSNNNKPKQSVVFFVMPDRDVPLTPKIPARPNWIPATLEHDTTGEFYERRLRGTRLYK